MSQSTPINLLRRNGNSNENTNGMENMNSMPNISMNSNDMPILDNNNVNMSNQPSESQLVEDILKEMGDSPGMEQQTNINSQALQYAMDSSQVPAYKQMDNNEHIQPMNPNNNYSEKMVHQQLNNNGLLSQIGINISGESLKDKIMKNFKYPILVFILSFIISLPEFNRFLFSFMPRLLLESGQVSIGGVLMKAFVGMLLFIIIALFL
jgi:hypothetical protein